MSSVGERPRLAMKALSVCVTLRLPSAKLRKKATARISIVIAVRFAVATKLSCSMRMLSVRLAAAMTRATSTDSAADSVTVAQPV